MKTIFSKEEMMQRKDCYSKQQVIDLFFSDNTEVTIETILTSAISITDKRWFVYSNCDLTLDEKKRLSLLLSWAVLPIYETEYPNDSRVRACLEGIEKFIKGEIPKDELLVLRRAANAAYTTTTADASYTAAAAVYAADSAADAYTTTTATVYAADDAATAAAYAATVYAAAAYVAAAAADAASGDLTYSEKLQLILIEFVK